MKLDRNIEEKGKIKGWKQLMKQIPVYLKVGIDSYFVKPNSFLCGQANSGPRKYNFFLLFCFLPWVLVVGVQRCATKMFGHREFFIVFCGLLHWVYPLSLPLGIKIPLPLVRPLTRFHLQITLGRGLIRYYHPEPNDLQVFYEVVTPPPPPPPSWRTCRAELAHSFIIV